MTENKVVIEIDNAGEISNFVQLLNKNNLFNNIDFIWKYEPSTYDNSYNLIHKKRVTFYFTEGKHATWFSLLH
jgi:hypothetical protein